MIKEYQPSANLFDEQYPSISTTAIYKPIYVGNGDFTLSTTIQKENDVALLFLLSGNVSTGIATNTNGVWNGQDRTVVAVDGYVTIAYRKYNTSPENYQTMLNSGSSALPYEPYGNIWNTKSYCKATTGSETYSNFPIVVRSREQSISSWNMKGNEQHTGTASPTSPIEINGTGDRTKNLFASEWEQGSIDSQGTDSPSDNVVRTKNYIPVTPNTIYSISRNIATSYMNLRFYNSNKQYIDKGTSSTIRLISGNTETNPMGVGIGFCCFEIIDTNIRYMRMNDNSNNTSTKYMMVEGQYTASTIPAYEPYGYKIPISANGTALTPVYLTEQLMEIGDYVDSLASSGAVTYQIKKIVLTGSENWTYHPLNPSGYFRYLFSQTVIAVSDVGICTHYTKENIGTATVGTNVFTINAPAAGGNGIVVSPTGIENMTTDSWKTYLQQQYAAGTPVTVYYVLATPTTEQVTVPTIPTTSSPTTIDVNTSVKPSEMSLTYDGYKICKEQKYQNNAWT